MAKHNELGQLGEALAKAYLEEHSYQILETNWRFSRAEIDIIAKEKDLLVFVEVKTRSSTHFGNPESFVDPQKEVFLVEAAAAYMEQIQYDWEIRFDIIGIVYKGPQSFQIKHFKDAFFPGLEYG